MIFEQVGNMIGAWKEGQAERKALGHQGKAIDSLQPIDVEKTGADVAARDIEFYNRSLEEFQKANPELAQARQAATEGLLESIKGVEKDFARTDQLLEQRIAEAGKPSPVAEEIRNTLLVQTRDNLNRGAQLPPVFQAELIRSGLEASTAVGTGGNKQGNVTQRLGTLLGSAGLALESQRRQEATTALAMEDALVKSRQAILGDLVSQSSSLPGAKTGFYGTTLAGLEAGIKPVGLTGRDLMQLDLNNIEFERQKKLMRADVNAARELSHGKAHATYAREGGKLVDSVVMAIAGGGIGGALGGMMGGGGGLGGMMGGGGGGGGGGGAGGIFSSLFGGGAKGPSQTVSSDLYGSVTGYMNGSSSISRTPAQWQQFNAAQLRYQ